jgi:hypothetical protein
MLPPSYSTVPCGKLLWGVHNFVLGGSQLLGSAIPARQCRTRKSQSKTLPPTTISFEFEGSGDGFFDKANAILQTPYDRTLLLGTDIYVAQPVPELFPLLDRFDPAATHEEYLDTGPRAYIAGKVYEQHIRGTLVGSPRSSQTRRFLRTRTALEAETRPLASIDPRARG